MNTDKVVVRFLFGGSLFFNALFDRDEAQKIIKGVPRWEAPSPDRGRNRQLGRAIVVDSLHPYGRAATGPNAAAGTFSPVGDLMRIPQEQWDHIRDEDVRFFLATFDEPEGAFILEVGANDESLEAGLVLSRNGFCVTGCDLRIKHAEGYREFIHGDFCKMTDGQMRNFQGNFDAVYSLSALEHFGMNTYNEGHQSRFYDVMALRQIWNFLKPNGVFYVTVPYGGFPIELYPDWRVYDCRALHERIVQDFVKEYVTLFFSAGAFQDGRTFLKGERVTMQVADTYRGEPPHLTVGLKLRKPL